MFKEFLAKSKNALIVLCSTVFIVIVCMVISNSIQRSGNKVKVETEVLSVVDEVTNEEISLVYKLYVPKEASSTNKLPAALLLHGYQNDHETCDAYCIELSRRGYVVMAIDEYGHGKTTIGFRERGYTTNKVSVNFGNEEEGTTFKHISNGGQDRYKCMMNFSNLSFFKDKYTKDEYGNELTDSSMGGISAYYYLSQLSYVDNTKMVISGHSMGTWAGWTVAAWWGNDPIIYPKALVLQCGELFRMNAIPDADGHVAPYDTTQVHFGNILLLQAKYDEFSYFRDYAKVVNDDLLKTAVRYEFLGTTASNAEWNKVYGSFALNTAREIYLVNTNHRLTTHHKKAIGEALTFISNATDTELSIPVNNTTYQMKELLVLIATLSAIVGVVAVVMVLKNIKFFSPVFEGVVKNRDDKIKTGWKWWQGVLITVLLSAFTYPFLTQLGHGLLPLPEGVFRMSIGNGFLCWYLFLIIVMLCLTIIPRLIGKKKGKELPDFVDYGLARLEHKDKLDWVLLGKGLLVAFIAVLFMYIETVLVEAIFQLDFRFIWPFFKGFNWQRFGQFLLYLPVFLLFFILNNSKIFAGLRTKASSEEGFKGFMNTWWRGALLMAGGIFLLCLLEYIPFFLNIGPGADLLFGSTFGGPFMSLLIVFLPQVLVFSLIATYCYRKTGNVYVGASIIAMMACWIVTGGSALF
ncbi:MAG: lysophospholipase [Gammaproteobacteria bacterium]|nr:lysophospholipase [Gammaproteobacteria bacterium]